MQFSGVWLYGLNARGGRGGGAEEGRVRYGRGGVGDRIRGHKGGKEIKGNVWKGRGEG